MSVVMHFVRFETNIRSIQSSRIAGGTPSRLPKMLQGRVRPNLRLVAQSFDNPPRQQRRVRDQGNQHQNRCAEQKSYSDIGYPGSGFLALEPAESRTRMRAEAPRSGAWQAEPQPRSGTVRAIAWPW